MCMKDVHYPSCDVFGLAFETTYWFQMGVKGAPCLYKAVVRELPALSPSRKNSFIAGEVR